MDDPEDILANISPGFPLSRETIKQVLDEMMSELTAQHEFGENDDPRFLVELSVLWIHRKMDEVIRQN